MLFLSDAIGGEVFVYATQRGDSLTHIGPRFGENPVVLARENGPRFPSVLNVVMTLDINNLYIAPKSDLSDGVCRVHSISPAGIGCAMRTRIRTMALRCAPYACMASRPPRRLCLARWQAG